MIYSVHVDYSKYGSRKGSRKFEWRVLAKNEDHAEEVIKKMVTKYPIKIELLTVMDTGDRRSLVELYKDIPELEFHKGDPERGYIFNENNLKLRLDKYFG